MAGRQPPRDPRAKGGRDAGRGARRGAEDEIEARRQCRVAANRGNRELPSTEPLRYECRPGR